MFAIFKKLGWYFKLEKKRYIIAITLLALSGFIEIIPPMMVGWFIDDLKIGALSWESITITLLQLTGITVVAYLLNYVWINKLFGGSFVVERMLRSR